MARIRFYIRSKISDSLAPVWIRFTDGRKINIRIATPFRMIPGYWNEKKQELKQRILYKKVFTEEEAKNVEDKFSQLKNFILDEHYKLARTGSIASKEWLSKVIDKFYYKRAPGSESLNKYIDRYLKEAGSGKRLNNSGKVYSASTLKSLKSLQSELNMFQGIYTEKQLARLKKKNETPRPRKIIDFKNITIDFYNDFLNYFNQKRYSPNTIGKHLKSLKTIMRLAREEGLHDNMEIERKAFKITSAQVESVYLTEEELSNIFKLDLSDRKHLEVARDVFLCGCYTAQRYSDYSRISKDNVRTLTGNKVIQLIQAKTGEKVTIPMRPELDVILKRYDYTLPKTYEQKVNKYIKLICQEAKITETIQYEEFKGGLRFKKDCPKYELIKTHTARRSGCTLMYLAGIPTIDIMKFSGHKTEREFLKYIRVTKEQTAVNLASHPYFKGNIMRAV